MLYDELKSAVKEIAEDFQWVCSKDGQIIMKIEDWIKMPDCASAKNILMSSYT